MLKVKSNNKSNLTLLSVNEFQVNLSSNDKIRLASMKLQYNHNKQNYETDRNIVLDKLNIMQKDNKQVMKETDLNDSYITNSKSKFFGGKPYNAIIETSNTYRFVYSTIKNNKTIFKSIYIWKNDSKFHNLDKISTNIKLNKQYK
mgnify:FL=1|tara:strand:+ start:80 stop:514 length:435 start_codon:yes stop_codon:yes gene_type:complete